jgi:DNA ligase (NAD+)
LEPVELGGVTVQSATLHNYEDIARKDIRIGDMLRIKRAGDVIPYVIGPVIDLRDGSETPVPLPEACPSCGEPVKHTEGEVAILCDNPACPEQLVRRVEHWVSRGAMDIAGLGTRIVHQLVEEGLVSDIADLYELRVEDLVPLEGFAEKKAQNLISSIAESLQQPLHRVLFGLGIKGVGTVAAYALVGPPPGGRFSSLGALGEASTREGDLESIEGMGPLTAAQIKRWFASERTQLLLDKLRAVGVPTQADRTPPAPASLEPRLEGQTFVITGTLPTLSRQQAAELIKDHGGRVAGSVSGRTDYLLCGERPGSKLARAQQLGVTVIDEGDLRALIAQ